MPGPYAPSDSRNYVGVGKQTVRGTGVVPTMWVPFMEAVDLDHRQTLNRIMEAGNAGQVSDIEKVSHIPTGGVAWTARPSTTARLYAYLMGVDTISGAGPYTHTITDDLVTDYLSLEQNLADEMIERFVDAVIAEITVTCDVANPKLRMKAAWVGGRPAVVSATAESYDAETPFVISDGVFTIDGAGATNVRKFTQTTRVKLSLEQISDVVAEYVVKLGYETEVELEQFTTDIATEYRKTHFGTTGGTAYTKTAASGAFVADFNYGAGGALREAKWEIPTLDYDQATYTQLNPDGSEAVRVVRTGVGRKTSANPLFRFVGKTNDSAAYVT